MAPNTEIEAVAEVDCLGTFNRRNVNLRTAHRHGILPLLFSFTGSGFDRRASTMLFISLWADTEQRVPPLAV